MSCLSLEEQNCCSHNTVFRSRKSKTGQKGPPAAAAPTIQFSLAKKPKQVRINEIKKGKLQLLFPRDDFRGRKVKKVREVHLQLLLPRYGFRSLNIKNRSRYMRRKCLTYSCCSHDTVFVSEKAKSGQDLRRKKYICSCCSHDTVFASEKAKTVQECRCSHDAVFSSEEAKSR